MYQKLKRFYKNHILSRPWLNNFVVRLIKHKKLFNRTKYRVKGKNNTFELKNTILLNVEFNIRGDNTKITIEENSVLQNVKFFIRGDSHRVHIKKNCKFSRGSLIWLEDNNGYLEIGENTLIEDVHFAITEPYSKIIIGKECMFAYNIDIRTGDSHSIIDLTTQKRVNYAKDVTIGNHVWLGANCKILKGVSIPNNSIVGTSSVVTKPIEEENSISAGNPAVVVKNNINWKIERIYDK